MASGSPISVDHFQCSTTTQLYPDQGMEKGFKLIWALVAFFSLPSAGEYSAEAVKAIEIIS